jgi:hypothetical protein
LAFATPRIGKAISKQFEADVIAEWKRNNYIDIFEVWHSETEGDAIIDILYPSLDRLQNGRIRYLCIICTGYNLGKEQAKDLVDLVHDNLRSKEGKELFPRDEVLITEVPKDFQQDDSKIKTFLKKELKF